MTHTLRALIAILIVLCGPLVMAQTLTKLPDPSSVDAAPTLEITSSSLADCKKAKKRYFRDEAVKIACLPTYMLFQLQPKEPNEVISQASLPPLDVKGTIKIGAFNVYHLGDGQAPLKNFAFLAKIMNQWDLVASVEMMPMSNDRSSYNDSLDSYLDRNKGAAGHPQFEPPGYIRLLKALQTFDPNWSLIVSTQAAGSSDGSGEHSGFFFRSSRISLLPTPACNSKADQHLSAPLGCLMPVPAEKADYISRPPFAASFRLGTDNITALAYHARFRQAEDALLQIQKNELCPQTQGKNQKCGLTAAEIGRFYEVKLIGEFMKYTEDLNLTASSEMQRTPILMGDFNLELNDKDINDWKHALPDDLGIQVFQRSASSLKMGRGLPAQTVSNYDHFAFNPTKLPKCDPNSAKIFDLTIATKDVNMIPPDSIHSELRQMIQSDALDTMLASLLEQIKVRQIPETKIIQKKNVNVAPQNKMESSPADPTENIIKQTPQPQPLDLSCPPMQNADASVRGLWCSNPFFKVAGKTLYDLGSDLSKRTTDIKGDAGRALMELVSDHLPIEMECVY